MDKITEKDMKILKEGYQSLDDKFGKEITIIDIRNASSLADFFIVTSGENPNQIKAMADEITQNFHKIGMHLKHSEGYSNALWILLDFGNIIVHVFDKENRNFYNLERIWGDAPRVEIGK